MRKLSYYIKPAAVLAVLAIYSFLLLSSLGTAEPSGAALTHLLTDTGAPAPPEGRTDPGGTIITVNLNAVQQNPGWKAYIGNITGKLVLRNADSQSIYEWLIADNSLTGNIFISRSDSVNWSPIRCANSTNINSEDSDLGFLGSLSDSVNKTFNYSIHKSMVISGVGSIANGTCRSTATYVNESMQVMDEVSTFFQEILLFDGSSLVYGTFVDQDAWGFDNNGTNSITHDFQAIVANPKNSTVYTYYFYADIN